MLTALGVIEGVVARVEHAPLHADRLDQATPADGLVGIELPEHGAAKVVLLDIVGLLDSDLGGVVRDQQLLGPVAI
jgi:hypothetical protein